MSYEQLKAALMQFFGDTSRSPAETKEGLENLKDEISILVESL